MLKSRVRASRSVDWMMLRFSLSSMQRFTRACTISQSG